MIVLPEKVYELIHQKLDDWVFGVETQAGEKLKVIDSADFDYIITEIKEQVGLLVSLNNNKPK